MTTRTLRMGMVGGGAGAFIGAVHRAAAALDSRCTLVAGALSGTPDKARLSGRELGLDDRRNYPTWEAMLDAERQLPRDRRIDFVSIVTPNHVHFPVAKAFTDAGFHVVCDKPLVPTSREARELVAAVKKAGTVFAVTYNYSGYPLVKEARALVAAGRLGPIRKVIVEYNQGWLNRPLEASGQKQADWRTDPVRSGGGGAIGDIGSHAEHLARYVTGLEITDLCADLTTFVPGRRVDDDASLLLRFSNGARGVLQASQICVGEENNLSIRVYGETGGLEWRQEEPNHLVLKPDGEPARVHRRGNPYLSPAAKPATRLPAGHPEAFFEAFANVYAAAFDDMLARSGEAAPTGRDYPTVEDGARGVWFIERTLESSRSEKKWTSAAWQA